MPLFLRPSRILPALAAACLAAAALSGCSSDSHVIARVGDHNITVAQYRAMAEQLASRYMAPPDSARNMLMNDMVSRELMLVSAKTNPATPDSYVTRRRKEIEEQALASALLDQMTPRHVGVSEAEVKQLYQWRQHATHCQIVFTTELDAARAARREIDAGADFAAVAHRFDFTGMLPPGGDLGFIEAGALVNPLDRIVRESAVGSIVGPTEAPGQGWFIVKIIAREPRKTGSLADMAPELRGMLEQRKQKIALMQNYADLRSEYRITPVREGIQFLFQRLNALRHPMGTAADSAAAQLTAADRAVVIGRWDRGPGDRGTLTVGEAIAILDSGHGAQLQPERIDSYDDWVRSTVLQRVAVVEARRRHLDQEPKLAERIRLEIENVVLQAVYQTEVVDRAEPNDMEVQETYERNAAALAQLHSVTLLHLTVPDSALAVSLAEKSIEAGSLKVVEAPGIVVRRKS